MTHEHISIRRAGAEDVAAIAALTNAAYNKYVARIGRKPQPMTTDYAKMVSEHPIWLLEIGPQIAGVLVLQHEPESMLIYSVAISPSEQKRGFGHLLLARAEQEARQAGYAVLRLYTNALMVENIALYTSLGYRETRREPHPVVGTVVYMSKPLPPAE